MKKLWQKNWQLDQAVELFETKSDLLLDQDLVEADILGSLAHAQGLYRIGLLSHKEVLILKQAFVDILNQSKAGEFILEFGDEDIHTKIENYVTSTYGDVGKKIHTGRSRNDQVLTAIRLYSKEQLLVIWYETLQVIDAFVVFAEQHSQVMMPGYTHQQKAMPSTIALWASNFAAGLSDDLQMLKHSYELNDQSPLGSAAGYGVPLLLDKQFTAELMGFNKVQDNPIYCQNSRGKIEAAVVASLIMLLQTINKFATDVLFFTTSESGFLTVSKELCSGSSIMPQKKNIDIAELLRSKVHLLLGNYTQLVSLSSNLFSGYNRDFQDSKKPLFESFDVTIQSLRMTKLLVNSLQVDQSTLEKALTSELFATQYALALVQQKVPFREAYQQAANDYKKQDLQEAKEIALEYLGKDEIQSIQTVKTNLRKELKLYQRKHEQYQTKKEQLLNRKGM